MAEKLNGAKRARGPKKGGTPGDGRGLIHDNDHEAKLAAEEAQLISFISKLRVQQVQVDEAKAALDVEKDALNEIFGLAKAAKFSRKELTELLADSKVRGLRKDLEEAEQRRLRFRKWLGLPAGDSGKQETMPLEAKDEIAWEADGYSAGVRGDPAVLPSDIPTRFGPAWLRGRENGQMRNAWADSLLRGPPADAPAPAGDADEFEASPAELAAQVGRPAADDEGGAVE